ncbi:MAG: hypothetical protein P8N94_02640 [Gammaproteobacteria bacterium]|nr:hypothetical protein [Gammaproteobacteria bacterium]
MKKAKGHKPGTDFRSMRVKAQMGKFAVKKDKHDSFYSPETEKMKAQGLPEDVKTMSAGSTINTTGNSF